MVQEINSHLFKIKGVAIVPGMSRNKIMYKKEELAKFAPTLKGKPMLMDHKNETKNIIGKIIETKFNHGTGSVHYSGVIKDKEVIELIKDGMLQNVSIGAVVGKLIEEELEDGSKQMVAEDMIAVELSTIPVPGVVGTSILGEMLNDVNKVKEGNKKSVRPLIESF